MMQQIVSSVEGEKSPVKLISRMWSRVKNKNMQLTAHTCIDVHEAWTQK